MEKGIQVGELGLQENKKSVIIAQAIITIANIIKGNTGVILNVLHITYALILMKI